LDELSLRRLIEGGETSTVAMRYVQEHGSITNGEYRQLTGISINTALPDLEALLARGSLKIIGKRRGRRYELP
jgi:predicted HTH transcriptional regulator